MKTSPIVILVFVAACAASGFVGYNAGQKAAPDAVTASSPASGAPAGGKNMAGVMPTGPKATLDSLLKGPGAANAADLAAWAKNLSPKECADLLGQLQEMKSGAARDAVIEAVLGAWAKSDPTGLLGAAGQVRSPKLRETGMDAALKAWAMQDPAGALQWLKENPGTASTSAARDRYAAIIAGYAATDPKGAFDTVAALSETGAHAKALKQDAIAALTNTLTADGRFADALTLFGDLPAGDMRDHALADIVKKWGTAAPEDAAAWSVAIADQTERIRLQGQIADAWASSDPLAAANWALQLDQQSDLANDPNNPTLGPGMTLANAILAWSKYDIDGPGNFLNQLPNSPGKDRAVAVFAMHAAEEDPESAAVWLGTITDRGIRSGVTMAVGVQMYQQDPAMFNNFVDTSTAIEDSQRQGMKQMMPLVSTSMGMISSMTDGKVNLMSTMMDGMLTGKASPLMNQIRTMQTQLQRAGGARGVINATNAAGGAPSAPPNPPPAQ